MSKLDALCAIKVMGWEYLNEANGYQVFMEAGERIAVKWHPSTSLDDALLCLERAANEVSKGLGFSIEKFPDDKWDARIFNGCTAQAFANADSAPLAMCLCSLRAMGVPESEISRAMEN